jgi:hypothetical protein
VLAEILWAEILWAEILVARRVEEVEAEPSCSKLITAEETEMPRSRPRALTSPASWIAPWNSSNFD